MVDLIIETSELPSGGAYTAVGTYDYGEMLQLITNLTKNTNISIPDLLKAYGKYNFVTFLKSYQGFFEQTESSFEFLESIDKNIHVEVKKLYPDAELPSFQTNRVNDNTLEMVNTSSRKLGHLAIGLIEKTMEYYGDEMTMDTESLRDDGSQIKFTITTS